MTKRFSHYLGAAILLVWGGMMVYFYASGRITVYLAEEFRIYTLVAGLGLCVLGLFNMLTGREAIDCCGHDHGEGGHDHAHEHGPNLGIIPMLFLLVPLLVAARISPDGYSATAVVNKGLYHSNYEGNVVGKESVLSPDAAGAPSGAAEGEADGYGEYTLADLEAQVDKSAEGNYLLTIPQLFYTAGDEELQRVLTGLPVETVGQVMPEKVNNPNGSRLRIFRLFIECCAADARPLAIPLEFGVEPPTYQEMGWVRVVGKMTYVFEDGMTVPILEVGTMEATSPPEDEMIF